jgi:hypothetical protein
MEPITRQVRDIDAEERRVLEHVIGQPLKENQEVIIQVVTPGPAAQEEPHGVPAWGNIYEGLTDEEVDRLDQAIRHSR